MIFMVIFVIIFKCIELHPCSFMDSPLAILANQGSPFPVMSPGWSCGPRIQLGFIIHTRTFLVLSAAD